MYLFERYIDFRSIHFLSKMNCHAESFFQNCSLIAPSRLSECVFIYCSIAPPWFTPLHAFPLSISFLLSSNTNAKNFLVSQGTLTTFTFEEPFFMVCLCSLCQPDTFSSASPSSSHVHPLQGFSRARCGDKCGGQTPITRVFQKNCRRPHSHDLQCDHMWLV